MDDAAADVAAAAARCSADCSALPAGRDEAPVDRPLCPRILSASQPLRLGTPSKGGGRRRGERGRWRALYIWEGGRAEAIGEDGAIVEVGVGDGRGGGRGGGGRCIKLSVFKLVSKGERGGERGTNEMSRGNGAQVCDCAQV